MSEHFQFQLSEDDVLTAMGEYVNRTLFKKPVTLTSIMHVPDKSFTFAAEPTNGEPRVSKPRKSKRGLAKSVLEPQAQVQNGAETEAS